MEKITTEKKVKEKHGRLSLIVEKEVYKNE